MKSILHSPSFLESKKHLGAVNFILLVRLQRPTRRLLIDLSPIYYLNVEALGTNRHGVIIVPRLPGCLETARCWRNYRGIIIRRAIFIKEPPLSVAAPRQIISSSSRGRACSTLGQVDFRPVFNNRVNPSAEIIS